MSIAVTVVDSKLDVISLIVHDYDGIVQDYDFFVDYLYFDDDLRHSLEDRYNRSYRDGDYGQD